MKNLGHLGFESRQVKNHEKAFMRDIERLENMPNQAERANGGVSCKAYINCQNDLSSCFVGRSQVIAINWSGWETPQEVVNRLKNLVFKTGAKSLVTSFNGSEYVLLKVSPNRWQYFKDAKKRGFLRV